MRVADLQRGRKRGGVEGKNGGVRAEANTGKVGSKIPTWLVQKGRGAYAGIGPPHLEFRGHSQDQCDMLQALHGYGGARDMSCSRPVLVR